jgi:hypothetical protein
MMRSILAFVVLVVMMISCKEKSYNPNEHLTATEKNAIVQTIVRYAAKPPENVLATERFDPKYDSFYLEKASQIHFERYYPKGDDFYFLITQPASSLIEKRHATGGRFKLSNKGELTEYEEIFRTWKMVPDTLKSRSHILFEKMVEGESLDPYLTKNSKGVDYIEFPDDNTFYDVASRSWRVRSNNN